MAEIKAVVSLEKAVHNSIQQVIQAIYDQHGIIVRGVNVEWTDLSTFGESKMVVTGIDIDSGTKYEIHARSAE